jgi:NADH-quinone oxidoreductase subunit L
MVDLAHPLASYALEASLLLPLLGTAAIFFGGGFRTAPRDVPQRWPGVLAAVLVAASLMLSVTAALATRHSGTISVQFGEWIPGFGSAFTLQLDWLSSWLLLLLETIGLMVNVFSLGYMKEERDQRRYFGCLLFFIGMMKLLILSGSYLLLFAGWEGVGLASYLLIGYHFERPQAAGAATKAFIVNRIGDAGFVVAIVAMGLACGSTNYGAVAMAVPHLPHGTVVLICSARVVAGCDGRTNAGFRADPLGDDGLRWRVSAGAV